MARARAAKMRALSARAGLRESLHDAGLRESFHNGVLNDINARLGQ